MQSLLTNASINYLHHRSVLGSLASCFNLLCTFTIIRSFGDMNKSLGEYGTFWFYMCWCIVGMFFVYFFLPETKGKSLDDIERMFANKKKQTLYATYAHPTIGVAEKAEPAPMKPFLQLKKESRHTWTMAMIWKRKKTTMEKSYPLHSSYGKIWCAWL